VGNIDIIIKDLPNLRQQLLPPIDISGQEMDLRMFVVAVAVEGNLTYDIILAEDENFQLQLSNIF
jgi:hypothetical protein